jgi:hypothetical protein
MIKIFRLSDFVKQIFSEIYLKADKSLKQSIYREVTK